MNLVDKINTRQARVAVVGLGYVGLPLSMLFARSGFRVTGIDNNPERVASLNAGRSYIKDVSNDELKSVQSHDAQEPAVGGCFRATTDYETLWNTDAVIVCVPTPLSKSKEPDLSYIVKVAEEVAKRLHPGELVVLESTSYPGTTEEILLPRFSQMGLDAGKDFYLAFSPERIDPGRQDWTLENTPKVVGGVTLKCQEIAASLYGSVVKRVIPVSSPRTAEMVKLLENTFRAVNIGLVNEMAIMCDRLKIDVWEVIDAAATKPFGFMPFYPGPGLGGHCIPVDPLYLAWKLRAVNYHARFIDLADQVNFGMPLYVVDKITQALNDERKALKGSNILVLGVTYKRDAADTRESPALDVLLLLQEKGAVVSYHDPFIPQLTEGGLNLSAAPLNAKTLSQADCLVVTTDHQTYDWDWIVKHSRLIVDTRNATRGVRQPHARVIKL